jgi:hypothetical protein
MVYIVYIYIYIWRRDINGLYAHTLKKESYEIKEIGDCGLAWAGPAAWCGLALRPGLGWSGLALPGLALRPGLGVSGLALPGLALRPGKGKFVVFLVDFWRGQLASHLGAEIAIWAMRDAKKCCVLSMKLVFGPAGAPAWDIHANACAPKWAIAGSESTVFYR